MFLAFKELSHSKLKYILVGIILTAILFLLFFVNGLASGLAKADSSALQNLAADFVVMNQEAEGIIVKSEIDEENKKEIYNQIEEINSTPLTMQISSVRKDNLKTDVIYFALNINKLPMPKVIEGKSFAKLTGNEVIVNKSIKNNGYTLNDRLIDENLSSEFIIAGFFEDQTYNHLPVVYTSLEYWNDNNLIKQSINNAILYNGAKVEIKGFDTLSKEEAVNAIPGYSETQGSLLMMITFLFIISAFNSTVFFYVITIQKTNQFGILKAIGAKTIYIAKSIIIQVVTITIISLAFSILCIAGMAQMLPPEMPFDLSVSLITFTGALFLSLNLIGSLFSVYKVSKVDALEAIGRVE